MIKEVLVEKLKDLHASIYPNLNKFGVLVYETHTNDQQAFLNHIDIGGSFKSLREMELMIRQKLGDIQGNILKAATINTEDNTLIYEDAITAIRILSRFIELLPYLISGNLTTEEDNEWKRQEICNQLTEMQIQLMTVGLANEDYFKIIDDIYKAKEKLINAN